MELDAFLIKIITQIVSQLHVNVTAVYKIINNLKCKF